jgi:hypothetical protein
LCSDPDFQAALRNALMVRHPDCPGRRHSQKVQPLTGFAAPLAPRARWTNGSRPAEDLGDPVSARPRADRVGAQLELLEYRRSYDECVAILKRVFAGA